MQLQSRLLAIDLGTKRTGIAVSDELRLTSRPLKIIDHTSETELLRQLQPLLGEFGIDTVILGLPVNTAGKEGVQAAKARSFGERLEQIDLQVILVDESFSSQQAQQLKHGKKSVLKSKRSVDAFAAKIILDTYLASL